LVGFRLERVKYERFKASSNNGIDHKANVATFTDSIKFCIVEMIMTEMIISQKIRDPNFWRRYTIVSEQ
jgi:hypothetical protein